MPTRTPSGKLTALGDVEAKLKKEYGSNKGAIYGTLNKAGLMRGNKPTAKGMRVAKQKDQQARAKTKPGMRFK
jgi:hypothetical protein